MNPLFETPRVTDLCSQLLLNKSSCRTGLELTYSAAYVVMSSEKEAEESSANKSPGHFLYDARA